MNLERRRIQKNKLKRLQKTSKTKTMSAKIIAEKPDLSGYGVECERPDKSDEEFENEKLLFLESLRKTEQERILLEEKTRLQSNSTLWKNERRKLLTASQFGRVCRLRPSTSCRSVVENILYKEINPTPPIAYGIYNEDNAKRALEQERDIKITPCGLFLDKTYPFLGATPDGLVGENGIVEIKCLYSVKDLHPEDAIRDNKLRCLNTMGVNKKHPYYYQIQGQLHVTQRDYCLFVLWTEKGIAIREIFKDNQFWEKNMEEKLTKFYLNCILPEIIDPRRTRGMPIKDPSYILEAKQKQEEARSKKK